MSPPRYGTGAPSHFFRGLLDRKLLRSWSCASRRPPGGSARRLACSATARISASCPRSAIRLPWPSQVRARGAHGARASAHRQFSEADLEAVAAALELERRYDISPASLAFGLRVLAEPPVRAAVADLGRRLGRIPATPGRALDFEKERALRLLGA